MQKTYHIIEGGILSTKTLQRLANKGCSRNSTPRLSEGSHPQQNNYKDKKACPRLKVLNSWLLHLAAAILEATKGYSRAIVQLIHLTILLNNEWEIKIWVANIRIYSMIHICITYQQSNIEMQISWTYFFLHTLDINYSLHYFLHTLDINYSLHLILLWSVFMARSWIKIAC
jgi:hypothetical protein